MFVLVSVGQILAMFWRGSYISWREKEWPRRQMDVSKGSEKVTWWYFSRMKQLKDAESWKWFLCKEGDSFPAEVALDLKVRRHCFVTPEARSFSLKRPRSSYWKEMVFMICCWKNSSLGMYKTCCIKNGIVGIISWCRIPATSQGM